MKLTADLVSNLVALCDSAATLTATVFYKDINHRTGKTTYGSKFTSVSNTSIAIATAPDAGVTRCIESINVCNTAAATELVTLSLAPATLTARTKLIKVTLTNQMALVYTALSGWKTLSVTGQLLRQVVDE